MNSKNVAKVIKNVSKAYLDYNAEMNKRDLFDDFKLIIKLLDDIRWYLKLIFGFVLFIFIILLSLCFFYFSYGGF